MRIVSWQSVLTDHQSHTIRALQEVAGESVLVVSGVKDLPERQGQGWTAPDISGLDVCYLPSDGWWSVGISILRTNAHAVHLFNGLWADRRFFFLLIVAQLLGIRTGLVTEPYSDVSAGYLQEESVVVSRIKVLARPWLYRLAGLIVGKRLCPVFAISTKAVRQFVRLGVMAKSVFPFGYFVPGVQGVSARQGDAVPELGWFLLVHLSRERGLIFWLMP